MSTAAYTLVGPADPLPAATGNAAPDWRERLATWAGAALSVAVLIVVARQLGGGGIARLAEAATGSPAFWAAFVLTYMATPACDWLIFRRLWRLPGTGLLALLRKEVSNELLFGYAGDAQFYLWARRHVAMSGSPFGAVKDVAVLSAVAGNVATLAMMAATAPMLAHFADRPGAEAFVGSVAVVVAISLALFLFRRAVFSLPARELRAVFAIHCLRIALHIGLSALTWHLLLPSVPLAAWMALATLRQMVTRLPLVSNKDILFAGLATFLLGRAGGVADAIATLASLTVGAHLLVGAVAHAAQLATREERA
ncbi:hypothetical protein [Sphingomonas sp.]|uniref:hypothetical protein n=1 Tax=Sphingomonas sp. TaxID=28214 RepID=UPI003CC66E7C